MLLVASNTPLEPIETLTHALHNLAGLDEKEFKGPNHFVLGQDTWKEDADFILEWLNKL